MKKTHPKPSSLERLRALLLLRGQTLEDLGRSLEVSAQHLRSIALGRRRASKELTEKLLAEIGVAGWKFVSGESDVLEIGA